MSVLYPLDLTPFPLDQCVFSFCWCSDWIKIDFGKGDEKSCTYNTMRKQLTAKQIKVLFRFYIDQFVLRLVPV